MLLRFRVASYASIRDEQELSLIALDQSPGRATVPVPGENLHALPAAGIFGPNASGKSNIIKAIRFARDTVSSHQWLENPIAYLPFELDHHSRHRPTRFTLDLVAAGVRYTYGFAIHDHTVHREWLHAYPHGQRQIYFQRDRNALRLSPRLASASAPTAQTLQPNRLHLPTAADIHPPLDPLRRWFDPHHTVSGDDQATARKPAALNDERLTALVRYAELQRTEAPSTPPNPHQPGHPGQTTHRSHPATRAPTPACPRHRSRPAHEPCGSPDSVEARAKGIEVHG